MLLATAACAERAVAKPVVSATLCGDAEHVQFSCRVGAKVVSLCSQGTPGAMSALAYRFGRPGHVELEHVVSKAGGEDGFRATTMPLRPGAQVQQVWFNQGPVRYLLAVCVGGNCPHEAALAVIRERKLIARWRCRPDGPPQQTSFSQELLRLGSDVSNSRSATPLLELDEVDNLIEQVFQEGAR